MTSSIFIVSCNDALVVPSIQCAMNQEERERMYQLCALIEKEHDRDRFLLLIQELNDLLERKEKRLENTLKS